MTVAEGSNKVVEDLVAHANTPDEILCMSSSAYVIDRADRYTSQTWNDSNRPWSTRQRKSCVTRCLLVL